ncbi:MAG: M23 family metallopeptidase [Paludibacteraceae bacterium]|nr:M23 family metallopeptidase [Paludibacteraceae bacterium]
MHDPVKDSFWKRANYKYRLSLMNEDTLIEKWHVRVSRLSAVVVLTLCFFFTLGILAVLIIFTPIRHVLPGYSESIREQLVTQTVVVDSLSTEVALQTQYIDLVKQIMLGDVKADTVQPLDSIQLLMRQQLLEAKAEATEEFMAQYEQKEKGNLQLFSQHSDVPVTTFFRPAHGAIVEHFNATHPNVLIQTPQNENITSVLSGTVVMTTFEINNTFTIVVQHDNYVSIYKNAAKVLKSVGTYVEPGESIAVASEQPLSFELWHHGQPLNPEEAIVF